AIEHVGTQRRRRSPDLKYPGPAVGTKFLYFLTAGEGVEPAPIMEALVRRWFRVNTDEHLTTACETRELSEVHRASRQLGDRARRALTRRCRAPHRHWRPW